MCVKGGVCVCVFVSQGKCITAVCFVMQQCFMVLVCFQRHLVTGHLSCSVLAELLSLVWSPTRVSFIKWWQRRQCCCLVQAAVTGQRQPNRRRLPTASAALLSTPSGCLHLPQILSFTKGMSVILVKKKVRYHQIPLLFVFKF